MSALAAPYRPRRPTESVLYRVVRAHADTRASRAGYVARFEVRSDFLSRYEKQIVGRSYHEEYWIPAEELGAFNDAIVGVIEVARRFEAPPASP